MSTPTQVAAYESLSVSRIDLSKALQAFEKNEKKNLAMGVFKNDGSTFKTLIKGSLSTNGINPSEYEGKKSYSLGVNFENESDITAFDTLADAVKEFTGGKYEFKTTPVKDDVFYCKLRVEQGNFTCRSNVKMTPKKLPSEIYRDQQVQILGELQVWVDSSKLTCGISFNPQNVNFELDQ